MKKDGMMKDVKKYAAGGMTDGRDRSEQMYPGGGRTGYNKIGMMTHGGVTMDEKMMGHGGAMKDKMMYKHGGKTMKPVDSSKNPGLSKLPKDVRNKMGYMKHGGAADKMKSHSKAHSKAHMDSMNKDMHAGDSFDEAHKKAMKKVGK
jgi:hypothetical protein